METKLRFEIVTPEKVVYAEDVDVLETNYIKGTLPDLDPETVEDFLADLERVRQRGWGEAMVDPLFRVELVSVKETAR